MSRADVERVVELAALAGIALADDEAAEVASRLYALLHELEPLLSLDLREIDPAATFIDDAGRDG